MIPCNLWNIFSLIFKDIHGYKIIFSDTFPQANKQVFIIPTLNIFASCLCVDIQGEVFINFNVLHSIMLYQILSYDNFRLIITLKSHSTIPT